MELAMPDQAEKELALHFYRKARTRETPSPDQKKKNEKDWFQTVTVQINSALQLYKLIFFPFISVQSTSIVWQRFWRQTIKLNNITV